MRDGATDTRKTHGTVPTGGLSERVVLPRVRADHGAAKRVSYVAQMGSEGKKERRKEANRNIDSLPVQLDGNDLLGARLGVDRARGRGATRDGGAVSDDGRLLVAVTLTGVRVLQAGDSLARVDCVRRRERRLGQCAKQHETFRHQSRTYERREPRCGKA